jgi:hypothetical protein
MSSGRLAVSFVVCTLLVLAAAWWFEMPLERAVVAAPIIVVSVGAGVAVILLWVKVLVESLRGRGE